MPSCTFVHAADVHLDAPFKGITQALATRSESSNHLKSTLSQATFIAFERLIQTCIDAQADFLLLAGDVYNSQESSLKVQFALRDGFLRLQQADIQVFWAHGNHDPLLNAAWQRQWPANVTVFGQETSVHPVEKNGKTIAVVYGMSHVSSRETQNLALQMHQQKITTDASAIHIGVLHCALQGNMGEHADYAPCTGADLLGTGFDYFALGHVHSSLVFCPKESGGAYVSWDAPALLGNTSAIALPAPLTRARVPLYAYAGSTQGLHVNEAGAHGCLICSVTEQERRLDFVPLAPVQWEVQEYNLEEDWSEDEAGDETLINLEEMIIARLAKRNIEQRNLEKKQGFLPEATIVRLVLTGRTSLNHALRNDNNLHDLQEHLAYQLEGSGVWVRDIVVKTKPAIALEQYPDRNDLAGELVALVTTLQQDETLLNDICHDAFAGLYKSPRFRSRLQPLTEQQKRLLLDDAQLLCLDLLEAE